MRKFWAEMFGTFVLVFAGVGTAVFAGAQVGVLGVSAAFGLALLVMVYAIGPISGCHINPAVTLGALLSKRISGSDASRYMGAQIVGGIIAAGVVLFVARGIPGGYSAAVAGLGANGFGAHSPGHYSMAAGFVVELIATLFLVYTVLAATDERAPAGFAGIAIGLVLGLVNIFGIPVTNMAANPARAIGPAVFVGGWALSQLWLFIVAPLIGGAIAAAIYAGTHGRSRAAVRKK
ncbi:MAG: aquaporin [Terriglobales bacterium]